MPIPYLTHVNFHCLVTSTQLRKANLNDKPCRARRPNPILWQNHSLHLFPALLFLQCQSSSHKLVSIMNLTIYMIPTSILRTSKLETSRRSLLEFINSNHHAIERAEEERQKERISSRNSDFQRIGWEVSKKHVNLSPLIAHKISIKKNQ